jgi:hypothetical protein
MNCRCPEGFFFRPSDTVGEMGACVENVPCGANSRFLHLENRCVPTRDSAECDNGEIYDATRDRCYYHNDCPTGETDGTMGKWKLEHTCAETCEGLDDENLVIDLGMMRCKCKDGLVWNAVDSLCVSPPDCHPLEFYHKKN